VGELRRSSDRRRASNTSRCGSCRRKRRMKSNRSGRNTEPAPRAEARARVPFRRAARRHRDRNRSLGRTGPDRSGGTGNPRRIGGGYQALAVTARRRAFFR
jgi:hypothetical protein